MIDRIVARAYQQWIDLHVLKDEVMGNCTIYSRVMKAVFPELIHVGGYVRLKQMEDDFWGVFDSSIIFGGRSHYHEYLRSPAGDIVDPTGIQFGSGVEYVECEEHLIT